MLGIQILCSALIVSGDYEPAPPVSNSSGAYMDCPCIGVENIPATKAILDTYRQSDGSFRTTAGWTASAVYGQNKCQQWDLPPNLGDPTCSGVNPPKQCQDSWCWVDSTKCAHSSLQSSAFPGLSYSYAACGSIGIVIRQRLNLVNRTIRVFVPGKHEITETASDVDDVLLRSQVLFASKVLKTAGATSDNIRYVQLSQAAHTAFPSSSYSACVWDTVIGNIDLCVGDFWDTSTRRSFGGIFVASVFQEGIYLYGTVPHPEAPDFWGLVGAPLEPFSGPLWAMLIGMSVLTGLAFCCFEDASSEAESPADHQHKQAGSMLSRCHSLCERTWDNIYGGLLGLVSGGVQIAPSTTSGKILVLGFSIFLTIVLASFTANTASFLVAKAVAAQTVANLDDALSKGVTLCASSGSSINDLLTTLYPKFPNYVTYRDEQIDCLTDIDSETVKYGVASEIVFGISRGQGNLCNTQTIAQPLLNFPTGWFASEGVYQALAEAIAVEKSKGTWDKIASSLFHSDGCSQDSSTVNDQSQLQPENLAGTCLILLFFFIVALVFRVMEKTVKRIKERRQQEDVTCDVIGVEA